MKYFAKVKYFGKNFSGFQVQPDKRTVQGELCHALAETLGGPVKVTGCSRTDAGVHANEFVIRIDAEGATVPADKLPVATIKFLPEDISLFFAKECNDDFHPRYDVKRKEYLYKILNTKVPNPFLSHLVWHLPRTIDSSAVQKMEKCAEKIVGKKDFSAFMAQGSDVKDTVRDIKYIKIERNADIIEIKICADGFLYNMVRIIVGTLVDAAFGRFSPDDITKIIESHDRNLAGPTAPASGLYLNSVEY